MDSFNGIKDLKVLFVDDEDGIKESFKMLLEMWTDNVYIASNGKEGIELYNKYSPDVVITDIRMPVMDGLDMISRIKEINPDVPVIIITAFDNSEYLISAINNKVDGYLVKPVKKKELKTKLVDVSRYLFEKRHDELKNKMIESYLDVSGILMVYLDPAGKVKMINKTASKILGIKEDEIIGKSWFEIGVVPEDEKNSLKVYFENLMSGDSSSSNDNHSNELVDIDGNRHEFIWLNIILKEKGKIVGVFSSAIKLDALNTFGNILVPKDNLVDEIEKREKIEKRLQEQENIIINQSKSAAMGEMISMIAHQWRQPLSTISMTVNNILADIELGLLDLEQLPEDLDSIIKYTMELSDTIDDFKDFFKPSKELNDVYFNEVYKKAVNIIGKSLSNNGIEIIESLESNKEFKTYPRELIQVLINIIKNAKDILIQKDQKERTIVISTKDIDRDIQITICDNGGGIAPENIDKVFEKYFTTKDKSSGTGLGLYICKIIVETHLKGSITVCNSDEGACFRILLPMDLV